MINTYVLYIGSETFKKVSDLSVLFSFLVGLISILIGVIIFLYRKNEDTIKKHEKQKDDKEKHYSNKIELIHKDYTYKMENISRENLNKYEEINKQWVESEKETLNVLNGVSSVLEMSEKMSKVDTDRIIEKINSLEKLLIDKK